VPRKYTTKAKNAQEAHEAIRPTDLFRFPKMSGAFSIPTRPALYELIWKRTIASQMESAEIERTTADIGAKGTRRQSLFLRATGSVVKFDGFLKLYQESLDDEEDEDPSRRLPLWRAAMASAVKVDHAAEQHFTEPPPRYSEATLIKKMEELGIGRPVDLYRDALGAARPRLCPGRQEAPDSRRQGPPRHGVPRSLLQALRRVRFHGEPRGEARPHLQWRELDWKAVLRDFWQDFTGAVGDIKELRVTNVLDALNEILGPHVFPERADGQPARSCPSCANGQLSLKLGKFGAFVGCSNYPDCRFTRQITPGNGEGEAVPAEGLLIGHDPETGQPVTRRDGRFGPYLQLGEAAEGEKPRRASIPKKTDPASIDLETALRLLSLPREVGVHPESGKPIVANFGRFGPFILHDGTYATLSDPEEVYTVGLNRAVTLLAEKKEKSANRKRPGALKDLGQHPDGGPVHVMSGRYGAYVKWGKINATIPAGKEPEETTLEEAVILLAARAGKGKAKKAAKPKAAKAPAKKAPAKKAAAKRGKKATSPDEVSA
jgi:DNA topoisomerase-1